MEYPGNRASLKFTEEEKPETDDETKQGTQEYDIGRNNSKKNKKEKKKKKSLKKKKQGDITPLLEEKKSSKDEVEVDEQTSGEEHAQELDNNEEDLTEDVKEEWPTEVKTSSKQLGTSTDELPREHNDAPLIVVESPWAGQIHSASQVEQDTLKMPPSIESHFPTPSLESFSVASAEHINPEHEVEYQTSHQSMASHMPGPMKESYETIHTMEPQMSRQSIAHQMSKESMGLQKSSQSIGSQMSRQSSGPQMSRQSIGTELSNQSIKSQFSRQSRGRQMSRDTMEPPMSRQSSEREMSRHDIGSQRSTQSAAIQASIQSVGSHRSGHDIRVSEQATELAPRYSEAHLRSRHSLTHQPSLHGERAASNTVAMPLAVESQGDNLLRVFRRLEKQMKTTEDSLLSVAQAINRNSSILEDQHKDGSSHPGDSQPGATVQAWSYEGLQTVEVRVVFLRIMEVDTVSQQFEAEIYVQARWPEKQFKGMEENAMKDVEFYQCWDPQLQIMNVLGELESDRSSMVLRYEPDNAYPVLTYLWHVRGVFRERLELQHFPFDVQELSIVLTSGRPLKEVELVQDFFNASNTGMQALKESQDWSPYRHVSFRHDVTTIESMSTTKHPILVASAHVKRRMGFYMWNVVIIVFIILCLSLTLLSVDPTGTDRLGITMTLFLTAVAFKLVVKTTLPTVSYLTYLDIYVVFTLIYLALQAAENAVMTHLAKYRDRDKVLTYDEIAQSILIALLIFFHAAFIVYIQLTAMSKRRSMSMKDYEFHMSRAEVHKALAAKNTSPNQEYMRHET